MIYAVIAIMFFFFGHAMGRAACMDYYPARVAESLTFMLIALRYRVACRKGLDVAWMSACLQDLQDRVSNGKIKFEPVRSMRFPGTVEEEGEPPRSVVG